MHKHTTVHWPGLEVIRKLYTPQSLPWQSQVALALGVCKKAGSLWLSVDHHPFLTLVLWLPEHLSPVPCWPPTLVHESLLTEVVSPIKRLNLQWQFPSGTGQMTSPIMYSCAESETAGRLALGNGERSVPCCAAVQGTYGLWSRLRRVKEIEGAGSKFHHCVALSFRVRDTTNRVSTARWFMWFHAGQPFWITMNFLNWDPVFPLWEAMLIFSALFNYFLIFKNWILGGQLVHQL